MATEADELSTTGVRELLVRIAASSALKVHFKVVATSIHNSIFH